MENETHFVVNKENEGLVDFYVLAPGICISFNEIYTDSWTKGNNRIFSDKMFIVNFCTRGRCDTCLTGNRYAIVKENQVCVSTMCPTKDFYYPGRLYEGVQLYIDRKVLEAGHGNDLLSTLGINIDHLIENYCGSNGLYLHRMNDKLSELVNELWSIRENPQYGILRYLSVRLLHELAYMPHESDTDSYFTRSQIAIVKEAEAMIMNDLTKRITAREMAEHFGISESSFKLYVKGILGDSYLAYFRKKRMEKAAELLKSTSLKVIEIANAVGYENQGKFARVFADTYGMSPLEYRRLRHQN